MAQLQRDIKALQMQKDQLAGQKKKKPAKNKKKKPSFKKMEKYALDFSAAAYARLLADPCKAKLVHPVYPEPGAGYLVRSHATSLGHTGSTKVAGYVLWFPAYHNPAGGSGNPGNIGYFETATSSGGPTNTVADPLWGGTTLGGSTIRDPCYTLVNNSTVEDARTIAACMTFNYLGTTSGNSGQLGIITDYPLSNLIQQNPSVDNFFDSSEQVMRVPENFQLTFAPDSASLYFRTPGNAAGSTTQDKPFVIGTPATSASSTTVGSTSTYSTLGFGFCWRGLNGAQTNDIQFGFTKCIEWRPQYTSSEVEVLQSDASNSSSTLGNITSFLDENIPDWRARGMAAGQDYAIRAGLMGINYLYQSNRHRNDRIQY
jgi:hypothetical protein